MIRLMRDTPSSSAEGRHFIRDVRMRASVAALLSEAVEVAGQTRELLAGGGLGPLGVRIDEHSDLLTRLI